MRDLRPLESNAPIRVGRHREQETLRACLTSTIDGRGHLALIGGEVGIGKTTLARQICSEAERRGAVVLTGQADVLTETTPYGLWTDLFARVPRELTSIDPPMPWFDTFQSGNLAALFAHVLDYFDGLTPQHPIVLLLEDVHWADPASLDLLRYLSRHLASRPVLVVVTYRADELTRHHPLSQLMPVLVRQTNAARLDLRRLEASEVRDLVEALYVLESADSARLISYLDERAEGNPLYIQETLRALQEERILRPSDSHWILGDLQELPVPTLLRQVIDGRVMRLGEDAYDLLSIAAVIGHDVTLSLWSNVSNVPEDELIDVIEKGVAAGIVVADSDGRRISFAHSLIRESLYEEILPPRRRLRHRRIADAMLLLPEPDPDAVAYHLHRASDPRATEWLINAGIRARRAYALVTAADRFEAALELLESQGAPELERAELLYRIARMRRYSDPRQALQYLDDAMVAAGHAADPVLLTYMGCFRGGLLCATGDLKRGLSDLESGLAAIDEFDDAERRHLRGLQERLGEPPDEYQFRGALVNWLAVSGQPKAALQEGSRVVEVEPARGIGTSGYANALRGLASAYALLGEPDLARSICARASDAYRYVEHPYQIGNARLLELFEVVLPYQADDLAERRRLAEEAEESWVRASGATVDLPPRFVWLPIMVLEGQWDEARQLALAARTPTSRRGWRPFATALLAIVAARQGDHDLAWELIHEQLPAGINTEPGDGILLDVVPLQRLAVELAIEAGDLESASSWLQAHERWMDWSGAVLGPADGELARAAIEQASGRPHEALKRSQRAIELASDPRQPLSLLRANRILGELLIATGNIERAGDHLDTARLLAESCIDRYELSLTLLATAELRHAQQTPGAGSTLEEARDIIEQLGASGLLQRANVLEAMLSSNPGRQSRAPGDLTDREIDVLRLVIEGRTDREIGDQLYISPRTVTTHVTRILTKLNVSSRTAAAAVAVRDGIV